MTSRVGGTQRVGSQAHPLSDVEIDDEHYARSPDPGEEPAGIRRGGRPRGGRPPGSPRGWRPRIRFGGLLRLVLFIGCLALFVLAVMLTVLRPVVAGMVVDWASQNPSSLRLPFVADLVREDLGAALTGPASADATDVEFTVNAGDTAAMIAGRLAQGGFLRDSRSFVFLTTERNLSDKLEAGTYILRRNMTPDQIVTALLVARDQEITIGLREGLRLEQVTAKLETLPLVDPKAFAQGFYDEVEHPPASLVSDYPWLDLPKGASLEGYLAAATYQVLPDITPDAFIRKLLDRFYATVGADRINVPKSRGLTFHQILTMASLVEREAVLDTERPLIAGVFQNRLDPNLFPTGLLQSDATVIYINDTIQLSKSSWPISQWLGYTFWAPPNGALTGVTLPTALEGYDTYNRPGLMTGPICTPTVTSIDAALAPDTKAHYLYFLAKGDGSGGTAFAKTLAEHKKNIQKYSH